MITTNSNNAEDWMMLTSTNYKDCKDKGFYSKEEDIEHYIGLILSELGEVVNSHRRGITAISYTQSSKDTPFRLYLKSGRDGELKDMNYQDTRNYVTYLKSTWEEEVADVFLRITSLAHFIAEKQGIELEAQKMAKFKVNMLKSLAKSSCQVGAMLYYLIKQEDQGQLAQELYNLAFRLPEFFPRHFIRFFCSRED